MVNDTVLCTNCENKTAFHRRTCHVCEEYIGFPNVRYAQSEETLLIERYKKALSSVEARNASERVGAFESLVDNSHVILVRQLNQVIELINNGNIMMSTFYTAVSSNSRLAENNLYDRTRESVDAAIHPNYHKEIHYGALSLGDFGVMYYGNCHIKLRSDYIEKRTSFFEENPFVFFKKHNHITGDLVPSGYRADWKNRTKLAVAKLHSKISNSTDTSDFAEILITDEDEKSDFIEAHIYGSMNASLFKSITISGLKAQEKVLLKAYKNKFAENSIEIKET